jgi:hypothetical protein
VKLQQNWEQSSQGRHVSRELYTCLLQFRTGIAAINPAEDSSEREFLRKLCANQLDRIRHFIAKKRITRPHLNLTQLVKLTELEERTGPSPYTAIRTFGFGQRDKLHQGAINLRIPLRLKKLIQLQVLTEVVLLLPLLITGCTNEASITA